MCLLVSNACNGQTSECSKGEQSANDDLSDGTLGLYFFGLPISTSSTYTNVLIEEYGISKKGGGDIVTEEGECYNNVMVTAIKKKYGEDVFTKVQKKADSLITAGKGNQDATFPGGAKELREYLSANNQWAQDQMTIVGKVFIEFIVNEDGSLDNIAIKKSMENVCSECDKEAIRLVKSMPKWSPRIENGDTVKSRKVIAINFGSI